MAKDARIPMRVPEALKVEFEWAAEQDGARGISTWLRQLGEARAEQLRAGTNGHSHGEPARDMFVPGFGLNEED